MGFICNTVARRQKKTQTYYWISCNHGWIHTTEKTHAVETEFQQGKKSLHTATLQVSLSTFFERKFGHFEFYISMLCSFPLFFVRNFWSEYFLTLLGRKNGKFELLNLDWLLFWWQMNFKLHPIVESNVLIYLSAVTALQLHHMERRGNVLEMKSHRRRLLIPESANLRTKPSANSLFLSEMRNFNWHPYWNWWDCDFDFMKTKAPNGNCLKKNESFDKHFNLIEYSSKFKIESLIFLSKCQSSGWNRSSCRALISLLLSHH